jgi:hypothetical protein
MLPPPQCKCVPVGCKPNKSHLENEIPNTFPCGLSLRCTHADPFVKITDEYLEIDNCASAGALYEVNVLQFDSTAHYPSDEILGSIYSVVNRRTHKPFDKNSHVKIYFSKYNQRYTWEIMKDPTLAEYSYQDTFHLKRNTWYKVRDESDRKEVYFLWRGDKGDYVILNKPLPGQGPW